VIALSRVGITTTTLVEVSEAATDQEETPGVALPGAMHKMAQAEEESNTEYHNAEQGPEDHQVARAITGTDEEHSKQWLEGVASENDAVKDMIIQSLWKEEDFRST
jgi:hypothetical protein